MKLDEFDIIRRLFAPLSQGFPGALGLKDDAALIDGPNGQDWAVTTDSLVEGVHFLPQDPPDLIARKLVRVNLSDLAAMGAQPRAILLNICLPRSVEAGWVERFAAGMSADCREFAISLIGGDTVATPGPACLSLTAFGEIAKGHSLLRSNARSGDDIWVSGTIGDAALGLLAALGGRDDAWAGPLLDRYRLPLPRLGLGRALVGIAHAAMDVSDGLVGDLAHIGEASHVGAVLHAEKIPLSAAASEALSAGLGEGIVTVLTGGDDYELLFTAPRQAEGMIRLLAGKLDLRLSPIGRIVEGGGVTVLDGDGLPMKLSRGGYRHFADKDGAP